MGLVGRIKTVRRRLIQALIGAWVAVGAVPVSATIIVDHQPHPFGGSPSDTELYDNSENPSWQRSADEVMLSEPATVSRITAWGFYHLDNPPANETFRLAFYPARADGLPDESNVHWQQYVDNPTRKATGQIIVEGYFPHEYFFEFDLSSPVNLEAGTLYWLEIGQIGDVETRFVWEDSVTIRDGFAFRNPATNGWRHTINSPNTLAFQLHMIPEPSMASFFLSSLGLALARRAPRRIAGGQVKTRVQNQRQLPQSAFDSVS